MTISSKFTSASSLLINETFIIVLAFKLMKEGYFIKGTTVRQVLNAFKLFFNLERLHEQKYSEVKNNSEQYEQYFDCLKFIPTCKLI